MSRKVTNHPAAGCCSPACSATATCAIAHRRSRPAHADARPRTPSPITPRKLGHARVRALHAGAAVRHASVEAQCATLQVPEDRARAATAARSSSRSPGCRRTGRGRARSGVHARRRPRPVGARDLPDASPRPSPKCASTPRDPGRPARHRRARNRWSCKDAEGDERGGRGPRTTPDAAARLRRALPRRRCRRPPTCASTPPPTRSSDLDAVREAIGAAADQPDGRVLRHARRAAVRRSAIRRTRARIVLDGSCRTRWCSATSTRATSKPRSTAAVRALRDDAGLRGQARRSARATSTRCWRKLRADAAAGALPRRDHRRVRAGARCTPGHVAGAGAHVRLRAAGRGAAAAGAERGRAGPLRAADGAGAACWSATLGDQIMHGMQLSVICTEDAAELRGRPDRRRHPARQRADRRSCRRSARSWPKGDAPGRFPRAAGRQRAGADAVAASSIR